MASVALLSCFVGNSPHGTAQDASSPPADAESALSLGSGVNLPAFDSSQEKISLEYRRAPLIDVVRTLADAAKINVAFSAQVNDANPDVNLRLSSVTYEVALKTILDLYRLGTVVENGIVRIDSLDSIIRERQQKIQEKEDKWKSDPTRVLVYQVNNAKAADLKTILMDMLRAFTSDKRFSIQADARTNKVILEGVAEALVKAKGLLDKLDRKKQQVLIEARVVEASNQLTNTLNVNWGLRFGLDGNRGLSSGLLFPNSLTGNMGSAGAGALGSPLGVEGAGAKPLSNATFGFTLGSINGLLNLDAIIQAYETENLANFIASPRVIVQDQEEANIQETTVVSRTITDRDGRLIQKDSQIKLELKVKPQITNDGTLELAIEITRDIPTTELNADVLITINRFAKTRFIVRNGDTVVIGGLYQTERRKNQSRIPILGSLPFIGALFRSSVESSQRRELMVLITPRILPNLQGSADSTRNAGLPPANNAAPAPLTNAPPSNSFENNAAPPSNNLLAPNNSAAPSVNNTAPLGNQSAPAGNNAGLGNGTGANNAVPPPNNAGNPSAPAGTLPANGGKNGSSNNIGTEEF